MRAPGVLGLLQLAVVVAFAVPLVLFGGDALLRGRLLLGTAFIALGLLMLILQWWLTNPLDPLDIAEAAAERLTGGRES
jgi:type VI protein secretion system component VasK